MENPQANASQMKVVLVTGPAGAGRTTAIHALEDIGFEAIDNLPLTLLPRLLSGPPIGQHLALGIDVRNRDFSAAALIESVDVLGQDNVIDSQLLYLDCSEEVLVRRFSETRRRHPVAPEETPLVGIEREKDLLSAVRDRADILVDTSEMSPHDLRAQIEMWFQAEVNTHLAVSVQSFSYKRGMPRGLDMVLDCRFLQNPYWQPELRNLNGMDASVATHVANDPRFSRFFKKTSELVEMLLPAYLEEGKSHFSIGFGCTGGQHRSVFLAETLAKTLAESDWQVSIRHRELERRAEAAAKHR